MPARLLTLISCPNCSVARLQQISSTPLIPALARLRQISPTPLIPARRRRRPLPALPLSHLVRLLPALSPNGWRRTPACWHAKLPRNTRIIVVLSWRRTDAFRAKQQRSPRFRGGETTALQRKTVKIEPNPRAAKAWRRRTIKVKKNVKENSK
jgi:hypothetical protein